MEDARPLVAIDRPEFPIADGEVAIAAQMGFVDHDVVRAVHRLELILAALQLHGGEHVFAIVVDVAAGLPEIQARHVRRIDEFVPVLDVLLAPEILDEQPDGGAFRMPQHEPGADLILNGNQVQFFADFPVVAAFDFFQAGEVRIELGLGGERGSIDPLEHRVTFVAAPVGSGRIEKLEGADMAGRRQVRTTAEIDEFTLGIGGDRLPVREALNQFNFIVFTPALEEVDRFLLAEFASCDGEPAFRNLHSAHFNLL